MGVDIVEVGHPIMGHHQAVVVVPTIPELIRTILQE